MGCKTFTLEGHPFRFFDLVPLYKDLTEQILTKGDVNYLMVISKDVQGSVTFNTRFARNKYVMALGWGGLPEHNVVTPLDAVSGDETEWKLDAGGYVIFKWDLGRTINEYISPTPGRIPIITSSPYPISKEPTVADITGGWEVFTALAFGAKGIEYWYYAQRPYENEWEYIISPLRDTRQRTEIWNYVRNVNRDPGDI